ncbi:MAG: DUF4943 family protein [Chitinophagales bacterium]|nr:DUF4943 family protein [Chitinophagales bacterium]
MRNLLICFTLLLLLVSCKKQNIELSEVEIYIEILKEDKTSSIDHTDFDHENISELLKYRNDMQDISNFPRNPLSSFYMEEVTLGMYVLWIIESIRMEEIEDPDFYLFASLNPRILRVSTGELVDQDDILPDMALAYFEWWNSSLLSEEKLQINPLENLDLIWN